MGWSCACATMAQRAAAPADIQALVEVVTFLDDARGRRNGGRASIMPSPKSIKLQLQRSCFCNFKSRGATVTRTKGGSGFLQYEIKACAGGNEESHSSVPASQSEDGAGSVTELPDYSESTEPPVRSGQASHDFTVNSLIARDELVSALETVLEDGPKQADSYFTALVKPLIRVVDGTFLSREGQVSDVSRKEEGRQAIMSMLWNPLGSMDEEIFRKKIGNAWHQAEADFYAFTGQLGKYIFIMMSTGVILATGYQLSGGSPHEEGVLWFSWLAGIILGSMIGANQVLENYCKSGTRNVVITGSTRGLGKALAREFLRSGDNVCIASRSPDAVRSTVDELQEEFQSSKLKVVGIACDVSKSAEVRALADLALHEFGSVDIWVNNAGMNKGFRPLVEFTDEEIEQIVSTNLVGSIICTREAITLMKLQGKAGHIFNMDGAGSGGASTPLTAVYGATKSALRQLHATLLRECKGSRVGIHTASPGMVLTDLLLSGASLQNKKMFNFICEQPETVARALVPYMRTVKGTGKAVNYLTPPRIILAIVTAWLRRGRWFDEEGRAVYAAEAERLRLWAEGRERSPVTAAMELVPSGTWVSLFSSSVICAYIILSSSSNGNLPGT